MRNTHVVIMAGGVGSRLYPLSTEDRPKQFLDLLGTGRTLLQMTVDRLSPLADINHFWIATSVRYKDIIKEQLPGFPEENFLFEPVGRNTAPCIAYACWKIAKRDPKANIVVLPSDAFILEEDEFCRVLSIGLKETAESGRIVLVGIKPNCPHTGYGYIRYNGDCFANLAKVDAFKEKPDAATAQLYLDQGNYLWNAGIFIWNADTTKYQIRNHAPQIAAIMDELEPSLDTPCESAELERLFPLCEKKSIDYAVMEKSADSYVLGGHFIWSDLGSFESIASTMAILGGEVAPEAKKRIEDIIFKKNN